MTPKSLTKLDVKYLKWLGNKVVSDKLAVSIHRLNWKRNLRKPGQRLSSLTSMRFGVDHVKRLPQGFR